MSLVLTVEPIAGGSIDEACSDVAALSKHLGIYVRADFNGVEVFCGPDGNAADLAAAYQREIAKPPSGSIRFASSTVPRRERG